MERSTVPLACAPGVGFVIPLGTISLVGIVARNGLVGCGAFDVSALDTFKYPAARVKPSTGTSIATIDDLLNGLVKEANQHAMACGVIVGMTGREAADLLS